MSQPKYKINNTIYLRESAMLGFIESYKVNGIIYDSHTSQWMYQINIKNRGPATSLMVDRVDLRAQESLYFKESELIEFCEAINLAISEAEQRINKLKKMRDTRCVDPS